MRKHINKPIPKEHWEKQYHPTADTGDKWMDAFNPKRPKDRPVPHNKVNETDT